jgi:predicted AAA+ superfamily ATPase
VKEVASPKFYLFDGGVARALAGRLREPIDGLGSELRYWRTPRGSDVDFIWTRARRAVGIEVKAATEWRREFGGPLKSLIEDSFVQSGFGIYTGAVECGPLRVLPLRKFLTELAAWNVLR